MTDPKEVADLVARLKARAEDERAIQRNNEAVASALALQEEAFNRRDGSHNTFAFRLMMEHRDCAKHDAALASDWDSAATTLETLSSELERVKGERDAALAQMKEESHEAFLCRKKVGQQKEIMLEAAAALNETLARAERAEASLGVAVKALRPAGNIAYNMKQTAIYTSDRENYRRISEAIDAALTSIQAKGE
jgi:hypothetical protein